MDIAIRNQANTNFRAVKISGYTDKVRKQALRALKEEGKIADIFIKPHEQKSTYPTHKKEILITDLKQEGRFPLPIKMTSDYGSKYPGIIANIQKIVKEFIKGDMSGGLYIPDKGAFPKEIDKAIPELEKLVSDNGINIFVLPYECKECIHGPVEHGYSIFVEKPNCEYTQERNRVKTVFTKFSRAKVIGTYARVKPVDFSYTHPYSGLITEDILKFSQEEGDFSNWSDLIVDVAEFYINNLKENKPRITHLYCRGS